LEKTNLKMFWNIGSDLEFSPNACALCVESPLEGCRWISFLCTRLRFDLHLLDAFRQVIEQFTLLTHTNLL
jgi:hypothetical protein